MKELTYIFVHGAGGWGSYNAIDRVIPYWGMLGGSLMKYLNSEGFGCHAASVDPSGSIWVRACELYAQLAGRRVDYGKAFSEEQGRERFGADFTGRPLIPSFDDETRLVLLGHSMGGATVRLFAHLLAFGDKKEREATPSGELSPLFCGGMGDRVHTIVTLAAPSNGSSVPDMFSDPGFDVSKVKTPLWSRFMMKVLSLRLRVNPAKAPAGEEKPRVSGIDSALAQNERISTLPHVYYFAIPCCSTELQPDGTQRPLLSKTEIIYFARSIQIGAYKGVTPEGFVIDESWRMNDGLVSTVSAMAPIGAPQKPFDRANIEAGIWQNMPVFDGDHMSVQGGMLHRRNVRPFYLDLLGMIGDLADKDTALKDAAPGQPR